MHFQMSSFYEDRKKVEALRDAMFRRAELFPVVENIYTYNEAGKLPSHFPLESIVLIMYR